MKSNERHVHRSLAEAIHPAHTALLIHDMQNDFCSPGGKIFDRAARRPETISMAIQELTRLVELARQSAAAVVYSQNMHLPKAADIPAAHLDHLVSSGIAGNIDDIPCIKGTWGHQIIDALKPLSDDIVIEKGAFNDFHNSMLDKVLRIQGVETVVLTGVSSHAGILGTVYGLLDCGYYFFVPRECVAGYDPELHDAAMKLLGPHVVGITDILRAWSQAGRAAR